jgi:sterol desaturase/sphingolipid hydroxylase (fatty acid hydroxylase superfamily)
LYYVSFAGGFAFLTVWEGDVGRDRLLHIGRNLVLLAAVILVADFVVGDWLLGAPSKIAQMPPGLLSALSASFAVQIIVGIFASDLFDYAFHCLCHRVRWLWLFHAVHHSDPTLDASTGVRFHPVETSLNVAGKIGLFMVLGLPLWIEGARTLVLNPLVLAQHANVRYPRWFERGLGWLIVTPGLHRLHHSPDANDYNSNFGFIFSFWDRLFGTYHTPELERAPRYGLAALGAAPWQTLSGMLLTPWRARRIRAF